MSQELALRGRDDWLELRSVNWGEAEALDTCCQVPLTQAKPALRDSCDAGQVRWGERLHSAAVSDIVTVSVDGACDQIK